ncbi:MAG: carboxypeptidase-like regulatory domain-containing protein [Armatimonadota bacterium]
MDAGSDVQLGELQAQDGGLVSGRVTLKGSDNSTRAAVRVPVYAIPDGAAGLAAGSPVTNLPPATTHYVTYTDGNGEYEISAMAPGEYLVTAAVAGYMADVQFIDGLTIEQRQRNKHLELIDDDVAAGVAAGVVLGQTNGGSSSLGGAGLRARLDTGYAPDIPQATIDRIEDASGSVLRDAPWFRWQVLSTLADAGGSYQLRLPPGTPRIDGFVYGYQPAFREPVITADATTQTDFTLEQN